MDEHAWRLPRAGGCARSVSAQHVPPSGTDAARAFATDALALAAAKRGVDSGFDTALRPAERMFLYLPFEHSESLDEQWRSIALMSRLEPYPETAGIFPYAVRHWEIVRRFGRFPHRNAALGRASTAEEAEFLKQPGSGF